MIRAALLSLFSATLAPGLAAESYPEAKSIVAIGGPVTEIVYALGQQDRLAARDTTSVFPPAAKALPDVGYMRALSAEGVLSVAPDLILARSTSGPPEALDQLTASAVPVVLVADQYTPDAVMQAVETVGKALGTPDKAAALVAEIRADFAALQGELVGQSPRKRVMFVLSLDGGRMNAAGAGTGADGLIALAGGVNVFADAFTSYKPVDAEAVIEAAPDVIVMMNNRGNHSLRKAEVMGLPAVALTPAGRTGGFVTISGQALGFGPRTADFARALNAALYSATDG